MGGGGGAVSNKKLKKQADYQFGLEQKAQQTNLDANRVNQEGPWGSVNWSQDPSGRWTQSTTLNPAEQQRLDQQRGLLTGLGGVAQGLVGQVGSQIGQAMDWSKFAQGPSSAPTGPQFQGVGGGPQFNTNFGSVDPNQLAQFGNAAAGQAGAGQAAVERAKEYDLQKDLDLSKLAAMPEASEAVRQQVIDAQYQQALSRLNPQWEQQRRAQLDRLYAMGGREGDQFFNEQQGNLERGITDQNQQTLWNAITKGGEEQSRLFGLGMQARQQGFNESLGAGNFRNQALMNQFQQGATNAGFQNAANLANAQMQTQASIANAGNTTQANLANANRQQQGLLAGLEFNRQGTQMANELAQQGWQNQLAGTQFNNQIGQQGFQNQLASNQEQSRIRDEQIKQALMERGLGMQEMGNVLNMMGQVQAPQYNNSFAQSNVNAPDYLNLWQGNQQLKAQQQQGMMGGLGALAGVAGSALGGPIGGVLANQMFKTATG
jgi:hypothetical protein